MIFEHMETGLRVHVLVKEEFHTVSYAGQPKTATFKVSGRKRIETDGGQEGRLVDGFNSVHEFPCAIEVCGQRGQFVRLIKVCG